MDTARRTNLARNAWRALQLAVIGTVWLLAIWWTEPYLPEWAGFVLSTLWFLFVVGAIGMAVEHLLATRRRQQAQRSRVVGD
jgi:hypothetical protein